MFDDLPFSGGAGSDPPPGGRHEAGEEDHVSQCPLPSDSLPGSLISLWEAAWLFGFLVGRLIS